MATIKLYDIFETDTLRNRNSVSLIFKSMQKFKPSENILIDFEKIVFVSRSFSNEFLMQLREVNKNVKFVNTNQEIDLMFKIANIKPKFKFSTPIKKKIIIDA